MFRVACAGDRTLNAWQILPPTLVNGEQVSAASVIDSCEYDSQELLFPTCGGTERTDLTFFYWQAYVATARGMRAMRDFCRSPLTYVDARSSAGDRLWLLRAPQISECVDVEKSSITYHPLYRDKHPLRHLSGKIKNMSNIHLKWDVVRQLDMFYIHEFPLMLLVSDSLVSRIDEAGITGLGTIGGEMISIRCDSDA